ncbi:hypothetical protein GCM10010123_45470 [Pilimelia anulata]|uniref:Secreted protein n=1 Tax=Pilimelia anulata TaxID=53371 RepID=A0A8J3BH11_9ACTN|nr:hypothetical protein [Pilimelia anulata]GGK10385.1 hypothetical protein GCM10010123_45470 [Pilimelia anulata]
MKYLTSRLLIAALAVPALCVGSAAPALAGGASPVVDPTGDTVDATTNEPVEQPEGDLVAANGRRTGDGLEFSFKAAKPTDPQTDGAWQDGVASAWINLDTNSDGQPEYTLFYGTYTAEGVVARVFENHDDGTITTMCDGDAVFSGGTNTFTFPLSCINSPSDLGYNANLAYPREDADEPPLSLDAAPDSGYAKVD